MDLLFALDDRFQNGVAEGSSIAPVARLLGADQILFSRRRRLRPLPGPASRGHVGPVPARAPGLAAARHVRADAEQRPLRHRWTTSGRSARRRPARRSRSWRWFPSTTRKRSSGPSDGQPDRGAGRQRRRRGRRRRRGAARTATSCSSTAPTGGSPTDVAPGCAARRHRQQPQAGPPVARIPGHHRLHRGRRAGPARCRTRPTTACPCSVTMAGASTSRPWPSSVAASGRPPAATATPNSYRPEDRAFFAVDGDLGTAWTVGEGGPGRRVDRCASTSTERRELTSVRLTQPLDPSNRRITEVRLRTEAGERTVALGEASWDGAARRSSCHRGGPRGSRSRWWATAPDASPPTRRRTPWASPRCRWTVSWRRRSCGLPTAAAVRPRRGLARPPAGHRAHPRADGCEEALARRPRGEPWCEASRSPRNGPSASRARPPSRPGRLTPSWPPSPRPAPRWRWPAAGWPASLPLGGLPRWTATRPRPGRPPSGPRSARRCPSPCPPRSRWITSICRCWPMAGTASRPRSPSRTARSRGRSRCRRWPTIPGAAVRPSFPSPSRRSPARASS